MARYERFTYLEGTMLPTHPQIDPLVEILRLAYRRGLEIRQGHIQEKTNGIESTGSDELDRKTLLTEQDPNPTGKEST